MFFEQEAIAHSGHVIADGAMKSFLLDPARRLVAELIRIVCPVLDDVLHLSIDDFADHHLMRLRLLVQYLREETGNAAA